MGNVTSEVGIDYSVYLDGQTLLGTTEITQPDIAAKTVDVEGAGISGTTSVPVTGHVQDMTGTLKFRTVGEDAAKILSQEYHHLEFWAAIQTVVAGKIVEKQHKIVWKAMPKNVKPGTMGVAQLQNRETEFNIIYFKEIYDGKELFEIDIFNYIYRVNGKDLLSNVKKLLGR